MCRTKGTQTHNSKEKEENKYILVIFFLQFSGLAYIPTCRSPLPTRLSQLANDCPMHYQFFTSWPRGLILDAKFTKLGGGLHHSAILQNFNPIAQTIYEICVTNIFHFLVLGSNPWAKVHQREDYLLSGQIYHPAIFHRHASTHAGDIRFKAICGRTKKETVIDIWPACLSACGDKKKRTHKIQ